MTLALITPPASEPLSLIDIKQHLRIDHDSEDALLNETLQAARQYTEFASGQKMISQVWRQYEICLPQDRLIDLRLAPVQSIDTITVFDEAGTSTILAASDVRLLRGNEKAAIVIDGSVSQSLAVNGLEIDCVVGFGDLGIDVPQTLKRAILLLVAHWYEFRGAVSPQDQPVSLPPGFDALMAPFRQVRL